MSKRYARFLTAVFCLFLGGLMVWQMLLPDRERSDVENRTLQQRPALTLSSVLDGSYMEDVEAYVQDQFPLRDQWTGLKARTEQLIGKRLFNNIYLCEGETLISKVDAPADGLEETNLHYVTQLAGNTDIPVYLGLIPSAAEVWRDKLPEGAASWDQNAYLQQAADTGLPMIDFSSALTAHAGEPFFYRTDHHWTSLGAFYGANALLEALGLPTHVERLDASALLSPMRLDKKNLGQTLRIILLKSIGQCYVENTSVDWFASLENYL